MAEFYCEKKMAQKEKYAVSCWKYLDKYVVDC